MKEKKTKVITFRCAEAVKQRLAIEADKNGWTISQLAEKIIAQFAKELENEIKAEERAKAILDYITETNCTDTATLGKWAIENDCIEEVSRNMELWKAVIAENKTSPL